MDNSQYAGYAQNAGFLNAGLLALALGLGLWAWALGLGPLAVGGLLAFQIHRR